MEELNEQLWHVLDTADRPQADTVRALLDAGADVNKWQYIHQACRNACCLCGACGNIDLVRLLLEYRPNLSGTLEATILWWPECLYTMDFDAVVSRRLEVLKLLLEAGANPNHDGCPGDKYTVICRVSMYMHTEYKKNPSKYWPYLERVLDLLLEYGADVNGYNVNAVRRYRSNLEYAISGTGELDLGIQRPNIWLVDALIRRGADVNLKLDPDDYHPPALDFLLYESITMLDIALNDDFEDKDSYTLEGWHYTIGMLLDAGAVPSDPWKLLEYRAMRAGYSGPAVNHHIGLLEAEKKNRACRVIKRALWKRVQFRKQMELLDELYKPGGLGTVRGQQRFDCFVTDVQM